MLQESRGCHVHFAPPVTGKWIANEMRPKSSLGECAPCPPARTRSPQHVRPAPQAGAHRRHIQAATLWSLAALTSARTSLGQHTHTHTHVPFTSTESSARQRRLSGNRTRCNMMQAAGRGSPGAAHTGKPPPCTHAGHARGPPVVHRFILGGGRRVAAPT